MGLSRIQQHFGIEKRVTKYQKYLSLQEDTIRIQIDFVQLGEHNKKQG